MRTIVYFFVWLWLPTSALALNYKHPYYGKDFFSVTSSFQMQSDIKTKLFGILHHYHLIQDNDFDRIVKNCPSSADCYAHKALGYKEARRQLFGMLFLDGQPGTYEITSFYCREVFDNSKFPSGAGIGPYKIPNNRIMNTEHSWPQSLFTRKHPKHFQKSDLHALFPVISEVNSIRSNFSYGEVDEVDSAPCLNARRGYSHKASQTVFEPSDSVKGDVARALFYFSTRYQIGIADAEEQVLRLWHYADPVSLDETQRQEDIYQIQNTRNPYIDYPELVDEVSDF